MTDPSAQPPYPQQPDPSGGFYYQPPQYPQPPRPPRKHMNPWTIVGISIAVFLGAVMVIGVAVQVVNPAADTAGTSATTASANPPAVPTTPAAVTTAPAPPPTPAGPLTSFGDGTWEIGTAAGQVAPGRYRTTVPASSPNCYWERLKGLSGSFDDIIANENADPGSPVIVTIAATDKGFKSRGCGTWKP